MSNEQHKLSEEAKAAYERMRQQEAENAAKAKEERWQAKPQTKKGNIGEAIVDANILPIIRTFFSEHFAYIEPRGGPIFNGSHSFDRNFYNRLTHTFIPYEVKTKPRRQLYPDTGVNDNVLADYLPHVELNDFLLIFVDEKLEQIYGQFLSKLMWPSHMIDYRTLSNGRLETYRPNGWEYPSSYWPAGAWIGQTYFPIHAMEFVMDLDDDQCAMLRGLRNSPYDEV